MKAKRQTARAAIPAIAVALIILVFAIRLVNIQVVEAAEINADAEGRRGVVTTLWGTRGPIVDADGEVLATSVDRFDITFAPVNMEEFPRVAEDGKSTEMVSPEESIREIAEITGQDPSELQQGVDALIAADPESNFGYLARMVPLEQYQQIRDLSIPWVYAERHPERVYPSGGVGANLTGFVGTDGTALAGLELQYEQCLAGTNGKESYERSMDGVEIPGSVVTLTEPVNGGSLQLTIDRDTQWAMQQILSESVIEMNARYGTLTVLEIATGDIVAAAEYPSLDPNDYSEADAEDRGARTFTAPFEPGSIMKPITAAMLYDAGVVSPTETIRVPDTWPTDEANFSDDLPHPVLDMNMNGVMSQSSNVGTAMFGQRLDRETRYEYLRDFGFGEPTDVGFIGEESGLLYDPETWDSHTNLSIMFGQGVSTTVAQMASAFQTIGNGGTHVPLRLVEGCVHEDGEVTDVPGGSNQQVVSNEAAALALESMEATAVDGWLAEQVEVPGYRIGMKTGTAQVVDPETGLYAEDSYITSMAGIAPMDDPQYVVLVTLANPTTISSSASTAPAWQAAMSHVLSANEVAPSPQPWPSLTVVP